MTFIVRSVPVAILATCKLVHDEARPIVAATTAEFILDNPPRIIDSVSGRGEGRMLDAVVRAAVKQYDALEVYRLGEGPCLTLPQLFEGRLRTALESKRSSRFVAKFIHQAGHQLRYGNPENYIHGLRPVHLVKYTLAVSGLGRHWALGADLHALNNRLCERGVAVVCAGVLTAGVAEATSRASSNVLVPHHVDFESYGLGCYIPSLGQMLEETWVTGWLE